MRYLILLVFITSQFAQAQLKVSKITNAAQLTNTLLGDAENIWLSNAHISGGQVAFGKFKAHLKHNNLFSEGIIICTGRASLAVGPNDDSKKGTKINFNSNKDINKIAEYKGCYDTAILEFDLVSATDEIQFQYFFASEEYPEFVFKNVNDVFIFLVTNTETKTSENIAVLNGDPNIPITVDHINHKTNSDYYIANSSWDVKSINAYKDDLSKLELSRTYQHDGFTTVLTATAKVIPNTIYHLKLGISDVGDQLYDSAIFLGANTLKSTGKKPTLKDQLAHLKEEISIDFDINFDIDSDKITGDSSFNYLDTIIEQLSQNTAINIEIIGHTDRSGTLAHNTELSEKRAKSVSLYLSSNGIDQSRITTKGVGFSLPKSEISSQNRRVEIVFKKEQI